MLDIKKIRKDPDFFYKKLLDRNSKIDLANLLKVDKLNRELIQKKEKKVCDCNNFCSCSSFDTT